MPVEVCYAVSLGEKLPVTSRDHVTMDIGGEASL